MSAIIIKKNNTYTAEDLYQWDTNRVLEIYGLNLSALPEIHFANAKMNKAIVKQALSCDNGVVTVMIPNILLETAVPIRVYICNYIGEEFISKYSFIIDVKARPKPEDYIAEDDEKIYSYNALENLVNNTVANVNADYAKLEVKYNEVNSKYEETNNTYIAAVGKLNESDSKLETATAKAEQSKKDYDEAKDFYNDASDTLNEINENYGDILADVQNKANKSTVVAATLSASGWSGNTYSFEGTYPVTTYDIEISLNSTATEAQAEAFNSAQIVGSATSNVVKAFGDVPTVNIPIIIKAVTK